MYLLVSNEKNVPVMFMGISAVVHGGLFILTSFLVLKLAEMKHQPVPTVIEVEYHPSVFKQKLNSLPAVNQNTGLPQKGESVLLKKDQRSSPKKAPLVHRSNLNSKEEDFSDLNLKGQLWEDTNNELSPDVDHLDKATTTDFENISTHLNSSDIDKDISQTEEKVQENTKAKSQKIISALKADTTKVGSEAEKSFAQLKEESRMRANQQLNEMRKASKAKDAALLAAGGSSGSSTGSNSFGHTAGGSSNHGEVGSSGSSYGVKEGVPNGSKVRSLGELQQKPGNKRPLYQVEDRKYKRQGRVVYYAFINSSGVPTKFVRVKSTGFESLDSHTLNALKAWRFYPGQQGWVELPFEWSLKGGVVEAPAYLRR